MIPNMYKIAGELTSTVFHVSARSLACQALSIFGDHSDVMATRQTGFALLASASVQEVHGYGSHRAGFHPGSACWPFVHFFDGFRTLARSRQNRTLSDEHIRAMMDDDLVFAHRQRALKSRSSVHIRGTAQIPTSFSRPGNRKSLL